MDKHVLNEYQPDYAVSPGEVLAAELELREMTQQELAEKAQVSRQTIIAIEAGKYSPSLELAFRIADVFGVEIGAVFDCEVKGE